MRSSTSLHPSTGPRTRARAVSTCLALATCAMGGVAFAQPAQPAPAQPAPAQPARPAAAAAPVTPDIATATNVADLTAPVPGGVTAEQVAVRAMQTSYTVKASQETLASQQARVEQADANWYPRLGLKASYTRLSDFTPPVLGGGGGGTGAFVVTQQPAGTVNPNQTVALDSAALFSGFRFPLILNQYLLQATIAVPISDYFLRIGQAASAASRQEEAARHDVTAAKAKSYSDGKVAYFTWLRARGAITVAQQALLVARAHLKDAENQFAVGNASKADVLRAQTSVAAAELGVERAKNGVLIAERQVRLAVHAKDEEKLEPGESLDGTLPPAPTDLKKLIADAQANRPELKSLEKNASAAKKLAEVQLNGRYPVLSGFGDVTYANPNQRRFPQSNDWFPTWSVGAQVTWSPNDLLTAGPNANDAVARANAIEAQKVTFRDAIELEVTQAYQSVLEADVAMSSTTRQLESAEEAYRVARELFNAGRGTSTTLIDAETALAQSRFEHLNAKVDARLARIRLDHALGHDVK